MLSAADLKRPAAFRNDSSLLPIVSCALNASTEVIGGGFVTKVAESGDGNSSLPGIPAGPDNTEFNRSLAWDISPRATLVIEKVNF
jgi:hypothetical protein